MYQVQVSVPSIGWKVTGRKYQVAWNRLQVSESYDHKHQVATIRLKAIECRATGTGCIKKNAPLCFLYISAPIKAAEIVFILFNLAICPQQHLTLPLEEVKVKF